MSEQMTRYILIECGEGSDPSRITVCDSAAERDAATLRAVFGDDPTEAEADQASGILETLREDGQVDFEGDPPLLWFTGEVIDRQGLEGLELREAVLKLRNLPNWENRIGEWKDVNEAIRNICEIMN